MHFSLVPIWIYLAFREVFHDPPHTNATVSKRSVRSIQSDEYKPDVLLDQISDPHPQASFLDSEDNLMVKPQLSHIPNKEEPRNLNEPSMTMDDLNKHKEIEEIKTPSTSKPTKRFKSRPMLKKKKKKKKKEQEPSWVKKLLSIRGTQDTEILKTLDKSEIINNKMLDIQNQFLTRIDQSNKIEEEKLEFFKKMFG